MGVLKGVTSTALRGRLYSIVCRQRRKHSASSFDMAHSFERSGQRAPDPARIPPSRDDPRRLAADEAHKAVILARTAERRAYCWRTMDGLGSPGRFGLSHRGFA